MIMRPVLFVLLVFPLSRTDGLFGGYFSPGSLCHYCPPGYGVLRMCDQNALRDITCVECGSGTFNERYTQSDTCKPCTKCPALHYAMRPCSRIKDTVCLPCWNKNAGAAYGNEDYLQKCESQTKPGTTPPLVIPPATTRKVVPTSKPGDEIQNPQPPKELPVIEVTSPSNGLVTTQTSRTLSGEKVTSSPMETTANETAPLMLVAETQTTSGSFQWQVLVAVLAGAAGVFILGIIVAVCLTRDKPRDKEYKLPKKGKPEEKDGGLDEPDVKTRILDTPDINSPEVTVGDAPCDVRSPLCQDFWLSIPREGNTQIRIMEHLETYFSS